MQDAGEGSAQCVRVCLSSGDRAWSHLYSVCVSCGGDGNGGGFVNLTSGVDVTLWCAVLLQACAASLLLEGSASLSSSRS